MSDSVTLGQYIFNIKHQTFFPLQFLISVLDTVPEKTLSTPEWISKYERLYFGLLYVIAQIAFPFNKSIQLFSFPPSLMDANKITLGNSFFVVIIRLIYNLTTSICTFTKNPWARSLLRKAHCLIPVRQIF